MNSGVRHSPRQRHLIENVLCLLSLKRACCLQGPMALRCTSKWC